MESKPKDEALLSVEEIQKVILKCAGMKSLEAAQAIHQAMKERVKP